MTGGKLRKSHQPLLEDENERLVKTGQDQQISCMKIGRGKMKWIFSILAATLVVLLWWDNILMGVIGNFAAIVEGIPSQQDTRDAEEVYQTIISHHNFDRSLAALPGRAPVFSSPGSRSLITTPIKVKIYYVTRTEDQDKIIRELDKLRKAKNMKPINVKFYSQENWRTSGPVITTEEGPVQSGERGPEQPIREVTIR